MMASVQIHTIVSSNIRGVLNLGGKVGTAVVSVDYVRTSYNTVKTKRQVAFNSQGNSSTLL